MNIRSSHAEAGFGASKVIWALLLTQLCTYFYWIITRGRVQSQRRQILVASTNSLLLVFAVIETVFTTQYLVWVLPLLAMTISTGRRAMAGLLSLSFALTQLFFPILLQALTNMNLGAHILSLARTALLSAYVMLLVRHSFGRKALVDLAVPT